MVEDMFQPAGPAPVIQAAVADAAGMTYTLYYPSTLTSDGFLNPVIAYGNGSIAVCNAGLSQAFGRHLASWGFVVACPDHSQTGFGTEIFQAVKFMIAENGRTGSAFQGQLDTLAIGVSGHSQGATGALNANSMSRGAIKSTVTLAFVDPVHHGSDQPRLNDVKGAVFLASGCEDPLTTNQDNYFEELLTPVVKACRAGATHATMVTASLGYTVAWFMYTLRGDARARSAFLTTDAQDPELSRNPRWLGWRSKLLP